MTTKTSIPNNNSKHVAPQPKQIRILDVRDAAGAQFVVDYLIAILELPDASVEVKIAIETFFVAIENAAHPGDHDTRRLTFPAFMGAIVTQSQS